MNRRSLFKLFASAVIAGKAAIAGVFRPVVQSPDLETRECPQCGRTSDIRRVDLPASFDAWRCPDGHEWMEYRGQLAAIYSSNLSEDQRATLYARMGVNASN